MTMPTVPSLLRAACAAALFGALSLGSHAAVRNVYDTAIFVDVGDNLELQGFGRGASPTLQRSAPMSFALLAAPATEFFFDTWNLKVEPDVAPGVYQFQDFVVEARGGVQFQLVTFNSINAAGVRSTIVFDLNAPGTQAVGSGTFTVLEACPIVSCLWIDVAGLQPPGSLEAGYGGTLVATPVPEAGAASMMLLGLALLGAGLRRRLGAATAA